MSPGNSVENLGSGYEMREALGYVSNCCNDRLAARASSNRSSAHDVFRVFLPADRRPLGRIGQEGAGVANVVLKMMDVVDARAAETPMVRGPYKKRDAEISS
jgi:hypothetical protein